MQAEIPTPQTTLVILLGASIWPYSPDFHESEAFANSANGLKDYFLDPHSFGLPQENLVNLFNSDGSPDDLDKEIGQFLDQRISKMRESSRPATDLLVYFVGHGGFSGGDSQYYLAIRRTRMENPLTSSIQIGSLAYTIKERARYLRRIIILDCCFAASAYRFFQSAEPAQIAITQAIDAFKVEGKGRSVPVPRKGTSILCSSRHNVPSLITPDNRYTMFSEALLHALHTGNPYQLESMSLRIVDHLIKDCLSSKYGEKKAPRPEVHSPDQSEGDVADVPFFPNFAERAGKAFQNAVVSPMVDYTPAPRKLREPKFINQLPIAVESNRFKNRVKEQKDIVRMFRKNERLISIYGHAGVGKTTLACKVLGDLQSAPDCPYDMVHLSKDSTGISLDGIFTNFGKLLMGEAKDTVDMAWRDREQSTAQKVSLLLDHLREGRYVLLLDGLEYLQDLKTYELTDPDMETFFERALQQARTLHILVTSRFPLALPLSLKSWERLIPLEQGLPTADAVDLLRTLDPDGRAGLQEAPIEKLEILAKETGGFPITLESVAGLLLSQKRLNQKPLSLDDILQDKKWLASTTEEFVQRVISQLSLEMIRVMEGVALLMEGLVRFERSVTYDALKFLFVPSHLEAKTLRETMDLLIETYFVTNDEVKKTFVLHQIDREYCYSRIPEGSPEDKFTDENSTPYTRYALQRRAANFYERERKSQAEWRSLDDLVPQFSEFEHRILADDYDEAARLINLIDANYLSLWGHVRSVQDMRQQLIGKITDRGLEEINLGSLGNAYYNLGQYEQAIDMYQQAWTLSREIGNRSGEGIWLGCLAKAYRNGKKLRDAVDYFNQALAISQETSKKSEEETNLDNLGLTYADLGEYELALKYGQQALAIALEIKDRRGESAILGNLGNAYYGLKQYEQAIDYHRQALEIASEVGDRRREGIHLGNLGRAYAALGQHKQAIELYERAIAIAREVGDRRGEGYRLDFLGRTYADLGQHKRAIELYEQARAIANEIGHKRNEGYALNSLGLAYAALGQREQAIEHYQRSHALFKALDIEYLVREVESNIAHVRAKQSSP